MDVSLVQDDTDQSVIADGQGEGEDHIQAARAEDGSFILAYLTLGNPVSIHMDKLSGKKVKAQWYNPRDGRFIYRHYTNTGIQSLLHQRIMTGMTGFGTGE